MGYSSSNVSKYRYTHPFVRERLEGFFRTVSILMSRLDSKNILSLGCGEGLDLRRIYDGSPNRADGYWGLDLNVDALRMSVTVLGDVPFRAICGDVANLPVKLQKFDLILCLELLEHLLNPRGVIEQISRQYIGYCIFSVPNEPLYRLTRMLLFRQNIRYFGNHPEHMNHWSAAAFQRLLAKYFRIDKVEKSFPWTVVLCKAGG